MRIMKKKKGIFSALKFQFENKKSLETFRKAVATTKQTG